MAPAYLVLATALVPCGIAYYRVHQNVISHERLRFAEHSRAIVDAVQESLDQYADTLRSLAGVLEIGSAIEPREWNRLVGSVDFGARYPGMRSIGFAPLVRRDNVEEFSTKLSALLSTNLPL